VRGLRGFALGVFGLIVLQATLRFEQSGKHKPSGILGALAATMNRALDPKVPAIPDLRAGGSSPGAPGATKRPTGQAVPKAASAYGGRVT
jgi:hypothetical protein